MYKALVLLIAAVYLVSCDDIPKDLKGGSSSNPGIELRITKKGLDYVTQVVGRVINYVVPKIQIKKIDKKLDSSSRITLTNLRVVKFKPPESYTIDLEAPDKGKLTAKNSNIVVKTEFSATGKIEGNSIDSSGSITGTVSELTIEETVMLDRTSDGLPLFRSIDCFAQIESLTLDIKATGPGAQIIQEHKPILQSIGKGTIAKQLCKEIEKYIKDDLSQEIGKLGKKLSLSEDKTNDDDMSKRIVHQRQKRDAHWAINIDSSAFFVDYGLKKKPATTVDHIDMAQVGEVSYHGNGGTPFGPQPMGDLDSAGASNSRMVYALAGDFVGNSFLYAIYKQGKAEARINDDTASRLAGSLRTSCSGGANCFADLFPDSRQKFPNYKVEWVFLPSQSPYLVLAKGTLTFYFKGKLQAYGISPSGDRSTWVSSDITAQSDGSLDIRDNKIIGKMTRKKLDVSSPSTTSIGSAGSTDAFTRMAQALADVVIDAMNHELQKGIPIPTLGYAKLTKTKMHILDRSALIETDIQLNENKLKAKAEKSLLKALAKPGETVD